MLSLQKLLVVSLNLYLSVALPNNQASQPTLHLVAAAPSSMPMMVNADGSNRPGEMGMGMGMARPSGYYYGGAGTGSAQATGSLRGSSNGAEGSQNSGSYSGSSSNTTIVGGGSPAAAQSLPNVETEIPSPVIASNPTYTLPALLQSGSSDSQAVAVTGSTGVGQQAQPQVQPQAQPQPDLNNISQAQASDTNATKSEGAFSWRNPFFRKDRALVGTMISAWLILIL